MSSLWTPDGERPVNRNPEPTEASPAPQAQAGGPTSEGPAGMAPDGSDVPLTPEQEEQARQMAKELSEARAELLEADVSFVVANHAMGLYELAAIHLTAETPKLPQARLAIDALAALVEGLEGRLGEHEETLNEALHGAKMAFVQRSQEQQPDAATTDS